MANYFVLEILRVKRATRFTERTLGGLHNKPEIGVVRQKVKSLDTGGLIGEKLRIHGLYFHEKYVSCN